MGVNFKLYILNKHVKLVFYDLLSYFFSAPWIKPPNYMHQALDANTVYLSWDDIPQTQIPGVLLGYRITYRPYYSDIPVVVTNAASMLLRTLRHLRPFTLYWVEICGYTIAGCGPSDLIIFKTPASGTFKKIYVYYPSR